MSSWIHDNQHSTIESQKALKDLEGLGYDVEALMRMNMSEQRIVDLRNKAFQYRGIQLQDSIYKHSIDGNNVATVNAKVDPNIAPMISEGEGMGTIERIIFLAEKELSEN
jgi:hypothetical protein